MRGLKKVLALVLILLMLLSFSGCNESTISESEITDAVLRTMQKERETVSLDRDKIEGFFGFSDNLLKSFSVLVSTNEEAVFEIGALTPDDNDDLFTIIDGITRRHNDTVISYKLINSTASDSEVGYLLMHLGDTVIYVLANDVAAAEQTLTEMGANEIN